MVMAIYNYLLSRARVQCGGDTLNPKAPWETLELHKPGGTSQLLTTGGKGDPDNSPKEN